MNHNPRGAIAGTWRENGATPQAFRVGGGHVEGRQGGRGDGRCVRALRPAPVDSCSAEIQESNQATGVVARRNGVSHKIATRTKIACRQLIRCQTDVRFNASNASATLIPTSSFHTSSPAEGRKAGRHFYYYY